jgi:hypothetical protein
METRLHEDLFFEVFICILLPFWQSEQRQLVMRRLPLSANGPQYLILAFSEPDIAHKTLLAPGFRLLLSTKFAWRLIPGL